MLLQHKYREEVIEVGILDTNKKQMRHETL